MENLAIIPARGGSKSIPRKNIKLLNGKPLIYYTINAAKKTKYVNRIIVDTDDVEIKSVALKFGADVPFIRPKKLAQDNTPMIPVIEHALLWLIKNEDYKPHNFTLLQPTTPFITPKQIDETFLIFKKFNADTAITMIKVPRVFHPYHIRVLTKNKFLKFENEKLHYKHPTRQSDPQRFAFGNLYWVKTDFFLKNRKIEGGKEVGLLIDEISSHDVNTKEDWLIAETILKNKL